MGKIWIDMTDLSKWSGNMTGVQRTVYEIAKRYNLGRYEAGYFVYDEVSRHFFEISFDIIEESINTPPQKVTPKRKSAAKKVAHKLIRQPVNYYKNLPDDLKERIPPVLTETVRLAGKGSEKVARTILHHIRQARKVRMDKRVKDAVGVHKDQEEFFGAQDVVVVLGASWDSKTKIIDIARLRQRHGFKYVQLIHDVIPSFNPHLFGNGFSADFSARIFESIANADLLLCNSKVTMSELKKLCGIMRIPEPSIKLVRLGDNYEQSSEPIRPECDLAEGEPFILCVGTYEIRKNYMLLYYVVREAHLREIEIPKIFIVGRPGWLVNDLTYMLNNDPVVSSKIHHLGGVSDEEKTWLFQNCSFTVFPAMFLGWVSDWICLRCIKIISNAKTISLFFIIIWE
jgi:glycosyltransferase involved in cell wall biosynthesis